MAQINAAAAIDKPNALPMSGLLSLAQPIPTYKTSTVFKAAFGRLAFQVTDTLTLTAAGRYTDDIKRMNGLSNVFTLFCGAPTPPQDFCPTVP